MDFNNFNTNGNGRNNLYRPNQQPSAGNIESSYGQTSKFDDIGKRYSLDGDMSLPTFRATAPQTPQSPYMSPFPHPSVYRQDMATPAPPHTPYRDTGALHRSVMGLGSPATPRSHFGQYDYNRTTTMSEPTRPRYGIPEQTYPCLSEQFEDYQTIPQKASRPIMHSGPQDYAKPFNQASATEYTRPQPYFSRRQEEYDECTAPSSFTSRNMMAKRQPVQQYQEPLSKWAGNMDTSTDMEGDFSYVRRRKETPSKRSDEEENFGAAQYLPPHYPEREPVKEKNISLNEPSSIAPATPTREPITMTKKEPGAEPTPRASRQVQVLGKLKVLSGPLDKVIKWGLGINPDILIEVIGPFASVHDGAYNGEKIIILREERCPVLQCIFQEIDRPLMAFTRGQLVRCVGKMLSKTKMRVFSVTAASYEELICIRRLHFICNRALQGE